MFFLPEKSLAEALYAWGQKAQLFTPQGTARDSHFAPYVPVKNENTKAFVAIPEGYVNTVMPPKDFVFADAEPLFHWEGKEKIFTLTTPCTAEKNILFGVRPCDAYGLAYMQHFFAREYQDVYHAQRQKHLFVISLNCTAPGAWCFCNANGGVTGPFVPLTTHNNENVGCDISLTPDTENHGYWVHCHGEKGQWLLAIIKHLLVLYTSDASDARREKIYTQVLTKFTKKRDFTSLRATLQHAFTHPIWEEMAPRCIACSGCTRVCSTCTCFTTHEEYSADAAGQRIRCWDSCQSAGFTRNAGWHNPRDWTSMVRYRIYDKLHYIEERFGMKGCTGCGRCSATCPAAINMASIADKLLQDYASQNVVLESQKIPFVRYDRPTDPQLYTPQVAEIIDLYDEAASIRRFTVRLIDTQKKDAQASYRPALHGQFYMLTDFGKGEVAISIPFSDRVEHELTFYIKKVGKVTASLFTKKVGDMLGIRGPYGVPFPYDAFTGRNLLVIGSGVGYAPVRAPLVRAIENYSEFKKIIIIASALRYEELMLKEDFVRWQKVPNVHVLYALAKPTDLVNAHIGYINDLLPGLEQDMGIAWHETSALICASARRIKAVAKDLLDLGMQANDIYTAMETNMRCGVGKCGHCKIGPHYVCIDGPVFSYEHMLEMPSEF